MRRQHAPEPGRLNQRTRLEPSTGAARALAAAGPLAAPGRSADALICPRRLTPGHIGSIAAAPEVEPKRFRRRRDSALVGATHGRPEAMAMADEAAVMNAGPVQQRDTPHRVFTHPDDSSAGGPAMNRLPARRGGAGTGAVPRGRDGRALPLPAGNGPDAARAGAPDVVPGTRHGAIPPHRSPRPSALPGQVHAVGPTGDLACAHARSGEAMLVVGPPPRDPVEAGDRAWLAPRRARLHPFGGRPQRRPRLQ